MQIRAERAVVNFEKDRAKDTIISGFADTLNRLIKEMPQDASQDKREALEAFYWLLEEFKVSLFAQELKTATRVSEKRLKDTINVIERMV